MCWPFSRPGVIGLRSVASEELPVTKLSGSSYTSSRLVPKPNSSQGRTKVHSAEAEEQTNGDLFFFLNGEKTHPTDHPRRLRGHRGGWRQSHFTILPFIAAGQHHSDGSGGGGGSLRRASTDRCVILGLIPCKTESFLSCFLIFNIKLIK